MTHEELVKLIKGSDNGIVSVPSYGNPTYFYFACLDNDGEVRTFRCDEFWGIYDIDDKYGLFRIGLDRCKPEDFDTDEPIDSIYKAFKSGLYVPYDMHPWKSDWECFERMKTELTQFLGWFENPFLNPDEFDGEFDEIETEKLPNAILNTLD